MIRHTVVFTLKHPVGSPGERAFLDATLALAGLPTVRSFERLRQVGGKNPFAFGLSMEFADAAAYEAYNLDPVHVAFVRDRWQAEVADFMEIDYAPL
ncbi:MAG TPA: Dabb family protein [Amaricoccus sp.]|nr:Dabb family protein [Amaricoccus sp.]